MRLLRLPAVLPAAAALLGAAFVIETGAANLFAYGALGALGIALAKKRKEGWWVAFLAAGALSAGLRTPSSALPVADTLRPIEARLRIITPWRPGAFGWSALAKVDELRQGRLLRSEPGRVWLQINDADLAPPRAGTLEVKGYLGRRQAFLNDPVIEPGPWRLTVKSRQLILEEEPPGLFLRASRSLRSRVEIAMEEAAGPDPPAAVALLRSLLLGDRSLLPPRWARALYRCGLGHLLAISGLHTGLFLLFAAAAGRLLPRCLRVPFAALVLGSFVLLVGPRPSVLRAAAMATLGYGALLLGRRPTAVNALGCYVLATVFVDPGAVEELGFRLSVAATAGLLILGPRLAGRWRLPKPLALSLSATVSAQLATMPWAVPVFSVLHPASPIFNLLGLPWVALFLGAGSLWILLAALSPAAASSALPAFELLAVPVEALADLPASPFLAFPWTAGLGVATGLAVLGLSAAWWPRKAGIPLAALACLAASAGSPPAAPELVLFDVGQGDSILLRSGGRALLLDGGGTLGGGIGDRVLVPALSRLGIRSLDAVAITHPDTDHCSGLLELADYLPIRAVLSPTRWRSSECIRTLEEGRRIPWRSWDSGRVLTVGEWRLESLHPDPDRAIEKKNDGSLVVRAEARGTRVLLTGDLEAAGERVLSRNHGGELASDILKVGHHGSRTSTGYGFLATVDPRLALISAGYRNRFGHPHSSVVRRLENQGARILRSDLHGGIYLSLGPRGEIHWR